MSDGSLWNLGRKLRPKEGQRHPHDGTGGWEQSWLGNCPLWHDTCLLAPPSHSLSGDFMASFGTRQCWATEECGFWSQHGDRMVQCRGLEGA